MIQFSLIIKLHFVSKTRYGRDTRHQNWLSSEALWARTGDWFGLAFWPWQSRISLCSPCFHKFGASKVCGPFHSSSFLDCCCKYPDQNLKPLGISKISKATRRKQKTCKERGIDPYTFFLLDELIYLQYYVWYDYVMCSCPQIDEHWHILIHQGQVN